MPTPIAIAVVEHENHFLIGQRPSGVALAGYWEFPGGKLEPGETPLEAAARECAEETGLLVEPLFEYAPNVQRYAHDTVDLRFIACRPRDPNRQPLAPYIWVSRQDLANYEFPSGNRAILSQLMSARAR